MMIRCFLALYTDTAAREAMAAVIACLRARNAGIRWERPQQVHITARFIGDMPHDRVPALEAALRGRLTGLPAFEADIDRIGGFPNLRRTRVIWLGGARPHPSLLAVRDACEDACDAAGLGREGRDFTPHFTIGRVRDTSDLLHLDADIAACSFPPIRAHFEALRIMRSTLAPSGAVHQEIGRIAFPVAGEG
jgi:2'-5' RNA ligase